MHGYFNYHSTDDEKRKLRIHVHTLQRSLAVQKKKREETENKLHKLEQENKKKQQQITELEKELEEIKQQRDMYKNMLFKKNVSSEEDTTLCCMERYQHQEPGEDKLATLDMGENYQSRLISPKEYIPQHVLIVIVN